MPALNAGVFTPYSTIAPLASELPEWVSELDRERLASYDTYEEIYWSYDRALKLSMRGTDESPIYIPAPRVIVDSTAHFLLKGLQVGWENEGGPKGDDDPLASFLKRERFYSKFHNNKHAGVVRGDYIFHMTADEAKPEGSRISLTAVDPASYFTIPDPNDDTKIIGVELVKQVIGEDRQVRVHRLRYTKIGSPEATQIQREEVILELEGWYKGEAAKVFQVIRPTITLPPEITSIPVYHFKNIDWQGQDFGSSELRGFERLIAAVDQGISDEELTLALDGLGVYTTDAPKPTDQDGNEEEWEVAPGIVLEIPVGTKLERVQGVGSVKPMQDHLKFLVDNLYEGSATFRSGQMDAQIAESGIALALRFMPTLAKIEQRDNDGIDLLNHMFFDWKNWMAAYESALPDTEIVASIGEKLPQDRIKKVNELNNMLDRQIISREFYRSEMKKLGYNIPVDMEEEVLAEERVLTEARQFAEGQDGSEDGVKPGTAPGDKGSTLPKQNRSNNRDRVNESKGTEATQPGGSKK